MSSTSVIERCLNSTNAINTFLTLNRTNVGKGPKQEVDREKGETTALEQYTAMLQNLLTEIGEDNSFELIKQTKRFHSSTAERRETAAAYVFQGHYLVKPENLKLIKAIDGDTIVIDSPVLGAKITLGLFESDDRHSYFGIRVDKGDDWAAANLETGISPHTESELMMFGIKLCVSLGYAILGGVDNGRFFYLPGFDLKS